MVTVESARRKLLLRESVVQTADDERMLRRALARGEVRRVHSGCYVAAGDWDVAHDEERHLLVVLAVCSRMTGGADDVVAHASAAVVHGLPIFRTHVHRVHTVGAHTDGDVATRTGVARHRARVPDEDRCTLDGIPCTTLERTLFDVMRLLPFEAALACADAALRVVAWDPVGKAYDAAAAEALRERVQQRVARSSGARGIRQCRQALAFADGRAASPLETVSRWYLHVLGFAPPDLQVRVPGPSRGSWYDIDFGLDDVDAWGEVDGHTKYFELGLTRGASPRQILAAEKEREDWVRGTTHRRFVRWGAAHLANADMLGRRLSAFGLDPHR